MEKFTVHSGVAAPLLRDNIDTDAIIPSREMKRVSKAGLGEGLFAGWRYTQPGGREPNLEFVLNTPEYSGSSILLGGHNFGCGSSREHAVWALHEYGIRAVLAPSFGSIFFSNCVRNGILPVTLPQEQISAIADWVAQDPQNNQPTIDLNQKRLSWGQETSGFELDEGHQTMLLQGLDGIDLTLQRLDDIEEFERNDRISRPWIYL
jgi:3-isopropylmalate/(R)-2-methylmalate dehydratase small subunit